MMMQCVIAVVFTIVPITTIMNGTAAVTVGMAIDQSRVHLLHINIYLSQRHFYQLGDDCSCRRSGRHGYLTQ